MRSHSVAHDQRFAQVVQLHNHYVKGELRLLVGAGVSIPSGFPGWDDLVSQLLQEFLLHHLAQTYKLGEGPDVEEQFPRIMLPTLVREMDKLFGKETLADLVAAKCNHNEWTSYLRRVLYQGRQAADLIIDPLQLQIASFGQQAEVYTTNFDSLLELAYLQIASARKNQEVDLSQLYSWHGFRCTTGQPGTKQKVKHLHGWVDPDGGASGSLIFSDTSYQELFTNPEEEANKLLSFLEAAGATLIVGMSLADPNLRRLLYLRRKHHVDRSQLRGDIYFVMRIEGSLLADYVAQYWKEWNINIIRVGQFDELPGLLRDIQWGPVAPDAVPPWTARATELIANMIPAYPFPEAWQDVARQVMMTFVSWVRDFYGLQDGEQVGASIFVPLALQQGEGPRLSEVASNEMSLLGYRSEEVALERSLSLEKDQEQGVAGWVFTTGGMREVLDMGEGMDARFTSDMKKKFMSKKGYRDWRSILSLPIFDMVERIPIGVVCVTSNMSKPFWTEFTTQGGYKLRELLSVSTRTFKSVMFKIDSEETSTRVGMEGNKQ